MKNKLRHIISYFLVLVVMALSLCGCGLIPSLELTDEETSVIAEYSAGLLMKYIKGHVNGLQKVYELDFAENANEETASVPEEEMDQTEDMDDTADEEAFDESEGEEANIEDAKESAYEMTMTPLNEAFGLYGAQLTFAYGEIVDSYPNDEENIVFSMNAADGMDLLILHFNLENPSDSALDLATDTQGYKVRAVINNDQKVRSDITILTNDMLNFSEQLEAGDSRDLVLVFELEEGTDVENLGLLLVNGGDQMFYQLV